MIDRTALAVLSIDSLLEGMGLDTAQRLQWYRSHASARYHSGHDYRERQDALRRLMGDPAGRLRESGGPALTRILTA